MTGSSPPDPEYGANYVAYLHIAERTGAVVEVVPDTPTGELDVEALDRMIDDRVRLISVNHVPTNGGLVNPAAAIGRVATPTASRTCSTPASRPARSRSMSRRSGATPSPRPAGSSCAAPGAPRSCGCGSRCSRRSIP
ncbi:MAG: aminotransferase class V-fold PLP-dependent enzyme [Acidimicrobiales bacterium]